MNLLTDHIAYLLTCHDCVIVPGLGAFIAGRTSARFDSKSGMIYPPCRELSFNATINNNDGLVAASVSRRENMPYAKALQTVTTEVDSLRHQLDLDGELVLPRIGRFVKGNESTPRFEPDESGIVNTLYRPLNIVNATKAPIIKEIPGEVAVKTYAPPRKARTFVRFAAAAALFLGIGFAATDSSLSPVGTVDLASMSPAATQRVSTIITDDINAATELFVALPSDPDATATIESLPAKKAEVKTFVQSNTPAYCLVVASLPSMKQARKFIKAQGDSRLRIVNSGSRYRVYIASGATFEQVAAAKTTAVSARYPDAWVCEN